MTKLYAADAVLYDIAFDWDIGDEAVWLVERLAAASVLEPGCGGGQLLNALGDSGLRSGRTRRAVSCGTNWLCDDA